MRQRTYTIAPLPSPLRPLADELMEIGILALLVIFVLVIGGAGAVVGAWLGHVVGRMGATGAPAQWVAQITGLGVAVLVGCSTISRLIERKWWWQ